MFQVSICKQNGSTCLSDFSYFSKGKKKNRKENRDDPQPMIFGDHPNSCVTRSEILCLSHQAIYSVVKFFLATGTAT